MPTYLDFEAPVAELEGKIAELRALAAGDKTVSIAEEVKSLEKKAAVRALAMEMSMEPTQAFGMPVWARSRPSRLTTAICIFVGRGTPGSPFSPPVASPPRVARPQTP